MYLYPARDLLFYHADIKGKTLTDQRMEVLRALIEKKEQESIAVITTMDAFLDGLPRPEEIRNQKITIDTDSTLDLTRLERELAELGYERESQIEGPGQFAVRGGIIDVFPLTEELPVRIEPSIRRLKTGKPGLAQFLFWNISQRRKASCSWMSPSIFRKLRKQWSRNISRAGRTASRRVWKRERTLLPYFR